MGLLDAFTNNEQTAQKANCQIDPNSKNAEFKKEFALNVSDQIQSNDTVSCSYNGVVFSDIPNMIKIEYCGLLAKNNAQEVLAVIGYGDNTQWEDVEYFPMQKTAKQTFELLTFRKRTGNINIAFKDNAEHWDNNSGNNYILFENS